MRAPPPLPVSHLPYAIANTEDQAWGGAMRAVAVVLATICGLYLLGAIAEAISWAGDSSYLSFLRRRGQAPGAPPFALYVISRVLFWIGAVAGAISGIALVARQRWAVVIVIIYACAWLLGGLAGLGFNIWNQTGGTSSIRLSLLTNIMTAVAYMAAGQGLPVVMLVLVLRERTRRWLAGPQ